MENFKILIVILLSSVFVDNYVLSRFLGICPFLGVSEKRSQAVGMGIAVTVVMLVASAITWPIQYFILNTLNLGYLQNIVFILIIATFVQILEMVLKKFIPPLYKGLGVYLPLITTNCAVLGAALVNIQDQNSFTESVVFGFASALGFTMAIVVFAGVRAKMQFSDPPKAFRGFPILLIAASLVAMAFSGFSGMKF